MKNKLLIFGLFLILTIVFTYPLSFEMASSIEGGAGDPLLNTWILGWDIQELTTDLTGFWNTNMFYPENQTLAYSEHLLGSALLGLPIFLLTKNIVFTYNFIILLSFLLSALGAYCLVYYLTRNKWAGIIAGIIYAFAPFRFAHLGHLQVLTSQWMPFCFLFLHKFFKKGGNKNLILFIFFFLFQALSCHYYGAFFSLATAIFILYYGLILRKYTQKVFCLKLFLSLAVIFLAMLPFVLPYFQLQKNMGFTRPIGEVIFFSAQPQSYLAAPPSNRLWGQITSNLGENEKYLFVGLAAMALIFFGWLIGLTRRRRLNRDKIFYLILLLAAFILSFGPVIILSPNFSLPGLYSILFKYVPGFAGMRVPARLAILVLLAASVLAGYGMAEILGRFRQRRMRFGRPIKYIFIAIIILVLFLEYISFPTQAKPIKVGKKIPKVYQWLAKEPSDFAIIELPMPPLGPVWYEQTPKELIYLYYSTYHWKKMVNGYSGYTAPSYFLIWQEMARFPSRNSVDLLRGLGVKYCVVHLDKYSAEEQKWLMDEINQRGELELVKQFKPRDYVYQIESLNALKKDEQIENLKLGIGMPEEISLPAKSPIIQFALVFRNDGSSGYVSILKKDFLFKGEWLKDGRPAAAVELIPPVPSIFIPAREEKSFIFQINSPNQSGVYDLGLIFQLGEQKYPFYLENINVNINK